MLYRQSAWLHTTQKVRSSTFISAVTCDCFSILPLLPLPLPSSLYRSPPPLLPLSLPSPLYPSPPLSTLPLLPPFMEWEEQWVRSTV